MVARAKRPSISELFGMGGIAPDYDPKAPWARGAESGQHRVEEPRATYDATGASKKNQTKAKTKVTAAAAKSKK